MLTELFYYDKIKKLKINFKQKKQRTVLLMEKSLLLKNLLTKAKILAQFDNSRKVNSDYFLMAALYAVDTDNFGAGVDEAEVQNVKKIIGTYVKDIKSVYSAYKDAVKSSDYDYDGSLALYNKIEESAELKVVEDELKVCTADCYLHFIFTKPSTLVKKLVLKTEATASSADADGNDGLSGLMSSLDKKKKGLLSKVKQQAGENWSNSGDSTLESDTKADDSTTASDADGIFDVSEDNDTDDAEETLPSVVAKVKEIQKSLLDIVYGQDHAVNAFASGYFQAEITALTQEVNSKPKATFLFAGPPGVGKTFLAEQAAKALGLPFCRFDMSEYADKEANIEFCGSDKVYKNGKAGNVTSFVAEHPKCVLLFDEVEKAHINVIHLFLQILDAGRIRDNYTDEEVSFSKAILIFTTNAGRTLYEDPSIVNLAILPRKQILNSLSKDINPATSAPLFPQAICSRFASGNVLMFNRLGAHNLLQIVEREFYKAANAFTKKTGVQFDIDKNVLYALLFAEGGNVDARTIRGRTANFFSQELFELFRLITSDSKSLELEKVKKIEWKVDLPQDKKVKSLFADLDEPEVLVFASGKVEQSVKTNGDGLRLHFASDVESAKEILFDNDISLILCDVQCGLRGERKNVLNLEDANSAGCDFLAYATENIHTPLYVLAENAGDISSEETLSFVRMGARGVVEVNREGTSFAIDVKNKCNVANQHNKLLELARANKILSFKTAQNVSDNGATAIITLFDCQLGIAPDAEDKDSIVSGVSRPTARFADVVGAEDAKSELQYFVDYLKDPVSYMRKGVRSPRGVLLYGPPGTGKTMLAKAMAGESDVTFIVADGNSFLKRFVGEGAEKVHELFRTARKYAPSILFVDEIDAIAKDRGSGDAGSVASDVLTAFLTEIDGFKAQPDKPVFVLAATNYEIDPQYKNSIDPALVRRFDRAILIDLPTKADRAKYIRIRAEADKNVQLSDEEIENIAIRSTGMSLANLETVFEFALRNAIKSKDFVVDDACFENAFETYLSGAEKKWDEKELISTARHEAGHAFVCWLSGETPSYLTIVARGSHGGYMQHGDSEKKATYTREELLSRIRCALAGRAAEIVYNGPEGGLTTGASGDLNSATATAERMICNYGMYEDFGLSTGKADDEVRKFVNKILAEQLNKAIELISANREAMDALVNALLDKNQLKGNEIDDVLSKYVKR